MYLKRVVLNGFKSFADRTEFDFGRGRTSIVGPNGCGKSNVLDAVRWVLGEQSAKTLRGNKMLDVVFSGSRSRIAAPFAEVELTFDNSSGFLPRDEKEITVGRLLYRSGDSEYRLNGQACRLKDVRDLLLDTGVGVDAYSVIEQGKVDKLLQSNPIERREIFEEAAGISRYKVRRTEAQRKLERTQNNLLRLNDVVDELERRLRSVKLAAGKARNFIEYDARLRELKSAFSLAEYHDLSLARRTHSQEAEALGDVLSAKRADLSLRDADAAELAAELQQLDEAIFAMEAELAAIQSEMSALAERRVQSQRRIAELDATRERQLAYAAETARRAAELEARLGDEERALAELLELEQRDAGRVSAIELTQREASGKYDHSRRDLETEKTAIFEVARRSTLLANERGNLEQQCRRLDSQQAQLAERRMQVESQRQAVEARCVELDARRQTLESRIAELSEQLAGLDATLNALNADRQRATQEINASKEARSAVLGRLQLLEDMERRREGVDQATRWVLDWSATDGGADASVVGLVADVLGIDDPRVGLLQGVLSRVENHVVVRDAHSFFGSLARRGEPPGPVGVLALDRVPAELPGSRYDDAPGYVASAIDWVRCDPAYTPLAQRLLGRVVIVDVLERALALAGSAPDGYAFVTLDGHTIESGGRLLVGAAKGVNGLISRKSEIRQLQSELDEVEVRLERATREYAGIEQSIADARLQRDAVVSQSSEAQRQTAEIRTERVRATDELARIDRESGQLASESEQVQRLLGETTGRAEGLAVELAAVEQTQRTHESRVGDLDRELRELEASVQRLAAELTAARVEAGRTAERRAAREQSLQELRNRLEHLRREHAQAERDVSSAIARIDAAQGELAAAEARHEECVAQAAARETEIVDQRQNRQQLRGRIEACGAAVKLLHSEIEEVDAALRNSEVALREIEVRSENLLSRVRDELSIDLAAAYAAYEHAERDWDAIKAEIEEVRGKISRLGNVNLDSIAELEELQPRYDNLVAQRGDLTESIQRLEALIAELDNESRTRFAATFEEIRGNFQDLFRKLFGGGKADIILENPEQPLECGIEIIARPPGKEPQSLTLLSGGEKTMTAVAMLFAVFKSKPSPFAILDEVDAALDEANIGRFNTIVDEFQEQSQFIVITHNKRTMQAADTLYGVTMEEPGVSKRVSVRFEDCVETSA